MVFCVQCKHLFLSVTLFCPAFPSPHPLTWPCPEELLFIALCFSCSLAAVQAPLEICSWRLRSHTDAARRPLNYSVSRVQGSLGHGGAHGPVFHIALPSVGEAAPRGLNHRSPRQASFPHLPPPIGLEREGEKRVGLITSSARETVKPTAFPCVCVLGPLQCRMMVTSSHPLIVCLLSGDTVSLRSPAYF